MADKQQVVGVKLHVAAVSAIGEPLWETWDPIGVNHAPAARNEYDGYAAGALRQILRGETDERIAEHLLEQETSSMGLQGSPQAHRMEVARQIRSALASLGIIPPDE